MPEEKKEIKKENFVVKTGVRKNPYKLRLVYDSINEGLEPIYFWILDFFNDPNHGIGYKVSKTSDEYQAAVGSQFWSDMSMKTQALQDRVQKNMQTINTVVRSMINLIYDLKDWEIRIQLYKDVKSQDEEKKKVAILGLKQIWLDKVDSARGVGSIHMMTRQLQFVTLRDAFLAAKDEKEAMQMDLNDRVKRVLAPRLQEFKTWMEKSEKDITHRFKVERQYLKSQVASLNLYAQWTKPYLQAINRLKTTEFGEQNPHIVNTFGNIEQHLTLFGTKEIKPASANEHFEGLDLGMKVYSCIEVNFKFRAVPHQLYSQGGQRQFIQGGRAEIEITPYVMTDKDLEALKKKETDESFKLIQEMVEVPLSEMKEDIDRYLKEEEAEEKKKEKEKRESVFGLMGEGFKGIFKPFQDTGNAFKNFFNFKMDKSHDFVLGQMKDKAAGGAKGASFVLYDVYKKAHGMLSW